MNSGSHLICRWMPDGSSGTLIIGTPGLFGSATTQLRKPYWVTMDPYRNLYVADYANSRVMLYAVGSYNPRVIVFDTSINIYMNDCNGYQIWKYSKL